MSLGEERREPASEHVRQTHDVGFVTGPNLSNVQPVGLQGASVSALKVTGMSISSSFSGSPEGLSFLKPDETGALNRFLQRSIGTALEKVPAQRERALTI